MLHIPILRQGKPYESIDKITIVHHRTGEPVAGRSKFKGELKARSLSVLEKGRVDGTIDAQRLAMREGALLNGSVNAGEGRSPARASLAGLTTG